MKKIILATTNKGKLIELQSLLSDMKIELLTPEQIGLNLNVEEDGATYAENASKKALAFARASGHLALADDTGLEVTALGGAPGLRSARYHPRPGASDAERRAYLLEKLHQINAPRPWRARFYAVIALATPAGEIYLAEGECRGEIIPEERGSNGFGYDPIFLLSEAGRTMAELTLEEKNRLSHRARAIQAIKPVLEEICNYPASQGSQR